MGIASNWLHGDPSIASSRHGGVHPVHSALPLYRPDSHSHAAGQKQPVHSALPLYRPDSHSHTAGQKQPVHSALPLYRPDSHSHAAGRRQRSGMLYNGPATYRPDSHTAGQKEHDGTLYNEPSAFRSYSHTSGQRHPDGTLYNGPATYRSDSHTAGQKQADGMPYHGPPAYGSVQGSTPGVPVAYGQASGYWTGHRPLLPNPGQQGSVGGTDGQATDSARHQAGQPCFPSQCNAMTSAQHYHHPYVRASYHPQTSAMQATSIPRSDSQRRAGHAVPGHNTTRAHWTSLQYQQHASLQYQQHARLVSAEWQESYRIQSKHVSPHVPAALLSVQRTAQQYRRKRSHARQPQVSSYAANDVSQSQLSSYTHNDVSQSQVSSYTANDVSQSQVSNYTHNDVSQSQVSSYTANDVSQSQVSSYTANDVSQSQVSSYTHNDVSQSQVASYTHNDVSQSQMSSYTGNDVSQSQVSNYTTSDATQATPVVPSAVGYDHIQRGAVPLPTVPSQYGEFGVPSLNYHNTPVSLSHGGPSAGVHTIQTPPLFPAPVFVGTGNTAAQPINSTPWPYLPGPFSHPAPGQAVERERVGGYSHTGLSTGPFSHSAPSQVVGRETSGGYSHTGPSTGHSRRTVRSGWGVATEVDTDPRSSQAALGGAAVRHTEVLPQAVDTLTTTEQIGASLSQSQLARGVDTQSVCGAGATGSKHPTTNYPPDLWEMLVSVLKYTAQAPSRRGSSPGQHQRPSSPNPQTQSVALPRYTVPRSKHSGTPVISNNGQTTPHSQDSELSQPSQQAQSTTGKRIMTFHQLYGASTPHHMSSSEYSQTPPPTTRPSSRPPVPESQLTPSPAPPAHSPRGNGDHRPSRAEILRLLHNKLTQSAVLSADQAAAKESAQNSPQAKEKSQSNEAHGRVRVRAEQWRETVPAPVTAKHSPPAPTSLYQWAGLPSVGQHQSQRVAKNDLLERLETDVDIMSSMYRNTPSGSEAFLDNSDTFSHTGNRRPPVVIVLDEDSDGALDLTMDAGTLQHPLDLTMDAGTLKHPCYVELSEDSGISNNEDCCQSADGTSTCPKPEREGRHLQAEPCVTIPTVSQEYEHTRELGDLFHKCLVCKKTFANSDLLDEHLLQHIQFQMDDCQPRDGEEDVFSQHSDRSQPVEWDTPCMDTGAHHCDPIQTTVPCVDDHTLSMDTGAHQCDPIQTTVPCVDEHTPSMDIGAHLDTKCDPSQTTVPCVDDHTPCMDTGSHQDTVCDPIQVTVPCVDDHSPSLDIGSHQDTECDPIQARVLGVEKPDNTEKCAPLHFEKDLVKETSQQDAALGETPVSGRGLHSRYPPSERGYIQMADCQPQDGKHSPLQQAVSCVTEPPSMEQCSHVRCVDPSQTDSQATAACQKTGEDSTLSDTDSATSGEMSSLDTSTYRCSTPVALRSPKHTVNRHNKENENCLGNLEVEHHPRQSDLLETCAHNGNLSEEYCDVSDKENMDSESFHPNKPPHVSNFKTSLGEAHFQVLSRSEALRDNQSNHCCRLVSSGSVMSRCLSKQCHFEKQSVADKVKRVDLERSQSLRYLEPSQSLRYLEPSQSLKYLEPSQSLRYLEPSRFVNSVAAKIGSDTQRAHSKYVPLNLGTSGSSDGSPNRKRLHNETVVAEALHVSPPKRQNLSDSSIVELEQTSELACADNSFVVQEQTSELACADSTIVVQEQTSELACADSSNVVQEQTSELACADSSIVVQEQTSELACVDSPHVTRKAPKAVNTVLQSKSPGSATEPLTHDQSESESQETISRRHRKTAVGSTGISNDRIVKSLKNFFAKYAGILNEKATESIQRHSFREITSKCSGKVAQDCERDSDSHQHVGDAHEVATSEESAPGSTTDCEEDSHLSTSLEDMTSGACETHSQCSSESVVESRKDTRVSAKADRDSDKGEKRKAVKTTPRGASPDSQTSKLADEDEQTSMIFCVQCLTVFTKRSVYDGHGCRLQHINSSEEDTWESDGEPDDGTEGMGTSPKDTGMIDGPVRSTDSGMFMANPSELEKRTGTRTISLREEVDTPTYTGMVNRVDTPAYTGMVSKVDTSTCTGMVNRVDTPTYTGMVSRVDTPTYTGMVSKVDTSTCTGMVNRMDTPTYTGMVNRVATPTYTGMVNRVDTPAYTGMFNRVDTPTYTGMVNRVDTPTCTGMVNRVDTSTCTGMVNRMDTPTYTGMVNRVDTPTYTGMVNRVDTHTDTYMAVSSSDSGLSDSDGDEDYIPPRKIYTPAKKTSTPRNRISNPSKKIYTPSKKVSTPRQKISTPPQTTSTPSSKTTTISTLNTSLVHKGKKRSGSKTGHGKRDKTGHGKKDKTGHGKKDKHRGSRLAGSKAATKHSARDSHAMFTCARCDQTYSSKGGLLFHWQNVHKKVSHGGVGLKN